MHGKLPVVVGSLASSRFSDSTRTARRLYGSRAWLQTRGNAIRYDVADRTDAFSLVVHAKSRRRRTSLSRQPCVVQVNAGRSVGRLDGRAGGRASGQAAGSHAGWQVTLLCTGPGHTPARCIPALACFPLLHRARQVMSRNMPDQSRDFPSRPPPSLFLPFPSIPEKDNGI